MQRAYESSSFSRFAGRALACAALGVGLAGCPPAPPASQFPTADDALGRMHACYDCALGVQGTAKVDLVAQQGRVKGDVYLFAVAPDRVRFDVVSPFGATIYTLTSDGRDFKLADQEQRTFFYGPATPCNLARFTQVPVPGHALVSLLRGEAPVLVHTKEAASIRWDDGHYLLDLPSTRDAEEEIQIGVHPDDFDKPWQEQRVRVLGVKVVQQGIPLYEAELSDHKPVNTAPPRVDEEGIDDPVPPSGPQCTAEIPHSIRFVVEHTEDDVLFQYKDGEAKWNPPLIEGTFTQPVPGGMRRQFTDCDRAP
jgi:hypothetical protein